MILANQGIVKNEDYYFYRGDLLLMSGNCFNNQLYYDKGVDIKYIMEKRVYNSN